MRRTFHHFKPLAWLLAALVMLQPTAAFAADAGAASVAVVAARDGDADEASRELAKALSELLRLMTDHHVVAARTAQSVGAYEHTAQQGAPAEIEALVRSAKEHHFAFRSKQALADIDEALRMLKSMPLGKGIGAVALDALLSKALIASAAGRKEDAREALSLALAIDPLLALDPVDYPPSLVQTLENVRAARGVEAAGTLSVVSRPAGADVFLNGIVRGVAPLTIHKLPPGSYALTVSANRYAPDERTVEVRPGKETRIKSKLDFSDASGDAAVQGDAGNVRDALAKADALKVSRFVTVDANEAGEGAIDISARMVDARARAGFAPIRFEDVVPEYGQNYVTELAAALADQLESDALADPGHTLDPVGDGEALVLGKRKKPLTRQPLFWGAIGVAVAGAIAGGIAAAMSGGSDTGSLKVSFR